jgi:hypothetical protein
MAATWQFGYRHEGERATAPFQAIRLAQRLGLLGLAVVRKSTERTSHVSRANIEVRCEDYRSVHLSTVARKALSHSAQALRLEVGQNSDSNYQP